MGNVPFSTHNLRQRNRYPGVKPFTSYEKELFFGREQDIEKFCSLLFIKQTVLLYGTSGYGKSSLLNAGVIPRLQAENEWTCYSVRFNNFSERDTNGNVSPMENIKLRLKKDLDGNSTALLDTLIPSEESFWYWVKSLQFVHNKSQFIFFFDQFEELFTYPQSSIEDFSEQLSQLLYNTVPVKFRKRLAEMDERGEVSDKLHQHLSEKLSVKVVFSVRSDRVTLLNALTDRHPDILQTYYPLDALAREQARDAIINPAKAPQSHGFSTASFDYTDGAIEKILKGIANAQDGKIETSTLQIVCRYVENELVAQERLHLITEDSLGDLANIFLKYYEGVLGGLDPGDREKARHLIEDELIEEGRRNTLTEGHIKSRVKIDGKLLWQLEQSSLLRKERDAAGRILYEISHDTLVNAIETVAKDRRQAEEEEKRVHLEKAIAEERSRAEHLIKLNKKITFRSRLATGLAIISLVVACFALFFWNSAKKAENTAHEQERQVKIMLFKSNLKKAKSLDDAAKAYIASKDYEMALDSLNAIVPLLKIDVLLPPEDQVEKKSLEDTIASRRSVCNEKLAIRK